MDFIRQHRKWIALGLGISTAFGSFLIYNRYSTEKEYAIDHHWKGMKNLGNEEERRKYKELQRLIVSLERKNDAVTSEGATNAYRRHQLGHEFLILKDYMHRKDQYFRLVDSVLKDEFDPLAPFSRNLNALRLVHTTLQENIGKLRKILIEDLRQDILPEALVAAPQLGSTIPSLFSEIDQRLNLLIEKIILDYFRKKGNKTQKWINEKLSCLSKPELMEFIESMCKNIQLPNFQKVDEIMNPIHPLALLYIEFMSLHNFEVPFSLLRQAESVANDSDFYVATFDLPRVKRFYVI